MPLELLVSLSPTPLSADTPADVTLELVLRNIGPDSQLVFPEAAGFHDGGGRRGPRFDSAHLFFPMMIWHDGMKSVPAEWYAARLRSLDSGAIVTKSVPCCWIPRRFHSPDAEASYLAFDHSAKWAPQFQKVTSLDARGRPVGHDSAAFMKHTGAVASRRDHISGKSAYLYFGSPGRHEVSFEYIHPGDDLELLGIPEPLHLVSRPMVLEIP